MSVPDEEGPKSSDGVGDGQEPMGSETPRPGLWARATGRGRVYQSGRDMHVAERDLHQHFEDGVHRTRTVQPGAPAGNCPYPGLAAFEADQAHWFFGRRAVVSLVFDRLQACMRQGGAVMVTAPSGAGKSSLLRAGVLAGVARGGLGIAGSDRWPRVVFTPSARPLEALAAALARACGDGRSWSADVDAGPAACVERMRSVLRGGSPGGDGPGSRWILVVDQLEELFTQCPSESERDRFVDLLRAMCEPEPDGRSPVALVLYGVRSDFLTPCADFAHLRTANDNGLLMGPMSEQELREAILFPARREGMHVEPGLVDVLLSDLGEPFRTGRTGTSAEISGAGRYEAGRLPHLAHALRMTWQQSPGGVLTVDGYTATGGIARALTATADRTLGALEPTGQQTARAVFMALVRLGEGTADSRKRLAYADLLALIGDPDTASTVIERFTSARLLTRQEGIAGAGRITHAMSTVEITHDVLLRAWPVLLEWLEEDRDGNLMRQQVEDAAASWEKAGRDSNLLYRGNRLDAALERRPGSFQASWSFAAAAFLAAGRRQRQRSVKFRRAVIAVLSVLALVTSGAASVAYRQRSTAQAERDAAVSARFEVQANASRSTDSVLAAAFDIGAYDEKQSADLYTQMVADVSAPLSLPLIGHSAAVSSVAFSPDGHTLASADEDTTIRLWDTSDPAHPHSLGKPITHTDLFESLAYTPDGLTLVGIGLQGAVWEWDVKDQLHPVLLGHTLADVRVSVAVSPDGRTLASVDSDGMVQLRDISRLSRPKALGQVKGHPSLSAGRTVSFSHDGQLLAVGGYDPVLRLIDVSHPTRPRVLSVGDGTDFISSLALAPDGRTAATVGGDATITMWDISDRSRPRRFDQRLFGHTASIDALAFSADGRILASTGGDDTVRLWNVTDPANGFPLGGPLTGHTDSGAALAFAPGGLTVASSAYDHTIRLWLLPRTRFTGLGDLSAVAFSSDSRLLATGDRTIELWNITDPARPRHLGKPITAHTDPVKVGAFSPDGRPVGLDGQPLAAHHEHVTAVVFNSNGRILSSATEDGMIRQWDVTEPDHPQLIGHPFGVGDSSLLAFSPDGRTLASVDGHAIRFRDLTRNDHPQLGRPLPLGNAVSSSLVFSPDGRTLASVDGHAIRFWDLTRNDHPQLGRPLPLGNAVSSSLVFSPDGRTLAAAADDKTIRLWDISSREHPRSLGRPFRGHTGDIVALAFSPDGRTLASAADDKTIRLWDISSREHPRSLGRPIDANSVRIASLAFSPDARVLAQGGSILQILPMHAKDAVLWVCSRAGITRQEWTDHLSELAYHPPCG